MADSPAFSARHRHERRQGDPRRRRSAMSLAIGVTPLQLSTPHPGWAEQDPETWWQASVASIRTVLAARARRARRRRSASRVRCIRPSFSTRTARSFARRCSGATAARPRNAARSPTRVGGEAAAARSRVQSRARGIHAAEGALAAESRAGGVRATVHGDAGQGFHSLSADRRAGDRAVRRVGDADVRHRATCAGARRSSTRSGCRAIAGARRRRLGGGARRRHASRRPGSPVCTVGTPVVGGGADNACGAAGVGVDRAGRSGRELGNVGHRARADRRSRASIPRLRAHTFCHVAPEHVVPHGRRAVGRRSVRLVPRPARARSRRHRRSERASQRRGGGDPAGRRGRDVPSVSPGRAHAASRRLGARRVPRIEPRALARASRRAR